MSGKEYLKSIEINKNRIERLTRVIQEIEDQAGRVSSFGFGTGSKSTNHESRIQSMIERKESAVEKLSDAIGDYSEIIKDATERIHRVNDSRYEGLLFKRYIECKQFDKIATEMNYEYQTVVNLHRETVKAFERVNQDIIEQESA